MADRIPCSIIIPVLNEQNTVSKQLSSLQKFRKAGHEVIVVDGGSQDDSVKLARPYADHVIHSEKGRARQMNKGAVCAKHDCLLFLHVDTKFSDAAMQSLQTTLAKKLEQWGHFDVRLSGQHFLYRVIAWFMNTRSRLTGIATGDQAIFVAKSSFSHVGGFPDIPLMEDISLSRKLKKVSAPVCLSDPVITSSRRWQQNGIVRTILIMWLLRLRYFLGTSPSVLAERYQRMSK